MPREHFFHKKHDTPHSLLRLLVVTGIISIVVILAVSIGGFYRVFSGFVIKNAEDDSVKLCNLLLDQHKRLLLHPVGTDGQELNVHKDDISALDTALRRFLPDFDIIKIKVYDLRSRIAYSSEAALIGKYDSSNRRLKNALAGNIDTKLETKDKAKDLADEQLLNVDVVETYVPIRDKAGDVLGIIEVYINVTKYRSQITNGVTLVAGFMILVSFSVYAFAYLLVRRGTAQLDITQNQLQTLAITDALTEISNRRHLLNRGDEEFNRLLRTKQKSSPTSSLGCIMIDMDHFKSINDSSGHHTGDLVLKEMAQRLRAAVRPYDVIGRYGGEEFLVLLPGTSLENTLLVAERIREMTGSTPFAIGEGQLEVTISLGVSCSTENDASLTDLLKRADEGLYKAKAGGRNRVAYIYHPFDPELHS